MIVPLIVLVIVLPFGLVLLYGAPYLPTRKKQAHQALDLLALKKGEVFVDLGSGDGIMLLEAAKQGLLCYGYELNPIMWLVSRLRTVRYRKTVKIYCRSFWRAKLPKKTRGVYTFLLDPYMVRLDKKLMAELSGATLVSYTFQIPNKKPTNTRDALFVYHY